MKTANLGAVRRLLLVSAVLTLSASTAGAQIVERSRTLADLLSSHPCNSGLAGRHTIVTDCDAADDLGNGGGAFSCFARCDGVDTWAAVSIGGGAGGSGEATSVQGSATLPATCTELDLYQDTNSGGTEFYVCTAANTWTKTGTGDVLLAGDADGQTIQGVTGADQSRIDMTTENFYLYGPGAAPTYADFGADYVEVVGQLIGGVTANGLYISDEDASLRYADGDTFNSLLYASLSGAGVSSWGVTTVRGDGGIVLTTEQTPPTNADDPCTAGAFIPTATFLYYCSATDTWVRVAMATWP